MKHLQPVSSSPLNVIPLPIALGAERAPAPVPPAGATFADTVVPLGRRPSARPWFPWPGKGCAGEAGWLLRDAAPVVEATHAFKVLLDTAEAGLDPLPPEARTHAYLLVGGPLGAQLPDYLQDNLRPLRERGFEARLIPPGANVEQGARAIREAVHRAAWAGRQVVLIGHSRGGVDAAAALALEPELARAVRALVAIQAPFGGSPLASDLLESPSLESQLGSAVAGLLRAQAASLSELTYRARRDFVERYPLALDVPAVCLASTRRSPLSSLFGAQDYLHRRYGQPSDGLVLPDDAVLPGARRVRLEELDHAESAGLVLPGSRHRPADLTLALVALALRAPPPAALALRAAA